ncbi:transcription factor PAR1 [Cinnamomum micranthum f. kanehirae]|uniref:Transcription factor PAR1 n=1 Tax=Cinnamomum micranthum f. kanehirae TaxID=337451 RepID=A0A3S3NX27_9MAGN|nr:transcription factor PAR1 [Cinnamomum micranthum f. kanehirae]
METQGNNPKSVSTKPISPFPSTHSKTNHPSLRSFLQRGREVKGRLGRKRRNAGCCNRKDLMESMKKLDGESEDEKVGVEKRIKALQRLVPGGESLDPERLFEETADYILALEEQVNAMKVLASFFDGLEKEKTKVGG